MKPAANNRRKPISDWCCVPFELAQYATSGRDPWKFCRSSTNLALQRSFTEAATRSLCGIARRLTASCADRAAQSDRSRVSPGSIAGFCLRSLARITAMRNLALTPGP